MVNGALALPQEEAQGACAYTPQEANKYGYAEFAGWAGERYLKKLLRQILPMALYRTWEIFAEHQAQGNDCYLGVTRVAEVAGRATRTVEKNLASLCAKQLLAERAERKLFRGPGQEGLQSRVVIIKDFRGLYALAHEYHEWLHSPMYLAPNREVLSLLESEPHLVVKLRRFENYRRLLYTRQPGPAVVPREEDRWFTEYQPTSTNEALSEKDANQVLAGEKDVPPAKFPPKPLAEQLAEGTLKRKKRETKKKERERASFDSGTTLFIEKTEQENAVDGDIHNDLDEGRTTSSNERASLARPDDPLSTPAHSLQPEEVPSRLHLLTTDASLEAPAEDCALSTEMLIASFLDMLVIPFGDQNPRGTRTRIQTLFSEAQLSHPAEIVLCLVRAYLVARDTRTIRSEHCHPGMGQVNRMPLFCSMVPRLLESSRQGPWWESDWQSIQETLSSDPCLASWWQEHQFPVRTEKNLTDAAQDGEREGIEEEHAWEPVPSQVAPTSPLPPRQERLSQTEEERETRASFARTVLQRLQHMAIPLEDGCILWEHLACGNPLYHRVQGREVCALCCPDPHWPDEVLALLHSIVEQKHFPQGAEINPERASQENCADEAEVEEREQAGWKDRDEAYAYAIDVLTALTEYGYGVEVFLELFGERYQVVVRGADGELTCTHAAQVAVLIEQAKQGCL